MKQCAVCGVTSTLSCAACGAVYYCSREHQKTDWKVHKCSCKKLSSSSTFLSSYSALPISELSRKNVKRVTVLGGGVIGACIAYSLALRGVAVELVEQESIAAAASGKAAGFLARDWFTEGCPRGWLMRTGFDLHEQLGAKHGARYDYRRMEALKVSMPEPGHKHSTQDALRLKEVEALGGIPIDWLTGPILDAQQMGTQATCAQVHPKKFTQTMVELGQELGVRVRIGTVENILTTLSPKGTSRVVSGIVVDGKVIDSDCVVIAMGPWSGVARKWLGEGIPVIYGQKCHSICVPGKVDAQACFVNFTSRKSEPNGNVNPSYEIYPRPDGEVYLHGVDEHYRVLSNEEARPEAILPTEGSCSYLHTVASYLSKKLCCSPSREQACHMPVVPDGMPCIGRVVGTEGAFIASGHGEWGVLMGPSTGQVISGLIVDGVCSGMSPRDWQLLAPSRTPEAATRTGGKTAK